MADLDFFADRNQSQAVPGQDFFADRKAASVVPTDPESPMAKFMAGGGIALGEGEAGPGTQAIASLPTEPGTRAQYYAGQRFPNDPQAISRYGMQDGKIFYVDDAGQGHFEESEARLPESVGDIPGAAAETGKAMAGSTGELMTVAGGTAGGIAGLAGGSPSGPGALATGIAGAAAGGAAADISRQALAAAFTGEEKSIIDRVMQTSGAALQEAGGQLVGHGITKGASFLGKTPTFDMPASSELGEKAGRFDIPLTAGERTGSRDLIRRQKILASTTQGDEVFENFYRMRNDKVRDAVYGLLRKISPQTSVRGASGAGVEGAQAAVGVERKALQRQAKPFYEEAYKVTNADTQPVIDLIDGKLDEVAAPVAAKLRQIRKDLMADGAPEGRVVKLDGVKRWLDDEIKKAKKSDSSLGKAQKFHLEDVRATLLEQADAVAPTYAKARGIYTEGLPSVGEIEKGVVGDIAKMEANDVLKATRILFNPRTSSVEDVALSRGAFEKAGKKAEWNDLVRAHLQDAFESIPESAFGDVTNLGGTFFRSVYKNPKAAGMLNEAMKGMPGASKDIQWFMQVMQATGRAAKGESITAFATAGQKQLAREAKPIGASVIETVEFWKSPSRLSRWWADMAEGRYARKMSELLTTPEGIKKLRELRKLSPKSAGAIIGVSHLLAGGGTSMASDFLLPERDVQPGGFSTGTPSPP